VTVGLLLAFLGYTLLYASVKGVHPWTPIMEAFGGTAAPPPGSPVTDPSGVTPGNPAGQQGPPTAAGKAGPTNDVLRYIHALDQSFHGWSNLGICVCKKVIGSSDWSDHSTCSAIDIGGSPNTLRGIVAFTVQHASELQVKYVIYLTKIWTPAEGWHTYSGVAHLTHEHVSFLDGGDANDPANRIAC
jgi:hypothetical protein